MDKFPAKRGAIKLSMCRFQYSLSNPSAIYAKAVVTDDESVFVTSANLTEAALDNNIEMGLLVRDRALAASVCSHFQKLIDNSLLAPLPMA